MLKQRVITALVLLAVFLPSLFVQAATPFRALSLVMIAAGAWEWARLNGCNSAASLLLGILCAASCAVFWWAGFLFVPAPALWFLTGLLWLVGAGLAVRLGATAWTGYPQVLRLLFGLMALFVAWIAVTQAWMVGVNFLLSVLALVWAADIGAYFAGKAFGGKVITRKLAPSISPGKSWEGVLGGMLGVFFLAWAWTTWETSPGSGAGASSIFLLLAHYGTPAYIASLVLFCGLSVLGDLFESLIKRAAGAKDSSRLLPGHGGVLDRVDALLPVLPVAMFFSSMSQGL